MRRTFRSNSPWASVVAIVNGIEAVVPEAPDTSTKKKGDPEPAPDAEPEFQQINGDSMGFARSDVVLTSFNDG